MMKKSILSMLVVSLISGIMTSCAKQRGATDIGAQTEIVASYSENINMPDTSFTNEEYEKLLALQFPGYEAMSVSDFQNKVWKMTDTADYRSLLERFSKSETLYECRDSDETASFLFYVLDPLTGDKWQARDFSGAASTDYSEPAENAVLEFVFTLTIQDADNLTVGEYDAARMGMTEGLQSILRDRTDVQLRDNAYMRDTIDAETEKLVRQWDRESLQIAAEYSYMPLTSYAKTELDNFSRPAEQETETRPFPSGTEEDYRSLLALKAPNYQEMPLADFNETLLEWADTDYERMERINIDIGWNDFPKTLTDEERSFVLLSINFSGIENGKAIQNLYTGREEDPCCNQYLPQKTEERYGRSAWCELFYQFSYHIADKKKITVGERDRCIDGVITDIKKFWEETDADVLLKTGKAEIIEKLQKIADLHSTKKLTVTIRKDGVYFECVDERCAEPYDYSAQGSSAEPYDYSAQDSSAAFAAYEKLMAYQTENYKQKSVAEFNHSLALSDDIFSENLDAYAAVIREISPEIFQKDKTYDFFEVTLNASFMELYCERFEEVPFFPVNLSVKERPAGFDDEWGEAVYDFTFFVDANLHYTVNSPETLTVAARDKALSTFCLEMQNYVDGLSETEISGGNIREMLEKKAAKTADRLSSKAITLSCEIDRIEIWDAGTE